MIADILDWGNGVGPRLIVPAIVVLVGAAAFGLGRLSALNEGNRGLVIYSSTTETGDTRPDYAP